MRKQIDAATFELAALECRRWKPESLAAVRMLLVEGKRPVDISKISGFSPTHINTLRVRFEEKLRVARLKQFRQQQAPESSDMSPFASDMELLEAEGYSDEQIMDYLKQQGVSVTADKVRKYLKVLSEWRQQTQ
ncbi:MAG: hypothetical protein FWF12_09625 [Betaproteobacteria bacterium]|nr:hypothetical protein [Betaproteobacteria bacterium]